MDAEVIRGAKAAYCHCALTPGHPDTEPHSCSCGGTWTGTFGGDDFTPITFPTEAEDAGATIGAIFADILGLEDD